MEFVQHYCEEGRALADPKLVAKTKSSENAVYVDEGDAMNMVTNTSNLA